MLIHSYLYYQMDESIISDDLWQKWADELTALHEAHPELKMKVKYFDREFSDWDGSTGMHLPKTDYVRSRAEGVLQHHRLYNDRQDQTG